ncbi:MIF4G domain-containing 1-like [Octopus vulgaris]|uniref:MIF4G domain-containing 1-like n=1 Tax=Octopus vulgaris TaxID=6645 RepID=A0AA36AHF7_OCTVU|nr:MIF4G domain-containing 1-like [Octopus vulgaris]
MKGIIKVTQRKENRKLLRKLKKLKNVAFSQRKQIPTLENIDNSKASEEAEQQKKRNAVRNKKRKISRKKKKMKLKELQLNPAESDDDKESEEEEDTNVQMIRKRQDQAAIKNEEKAIKELEKKLGLKKRKTLPQSFIDDGLGYILDVAGDFKNCGLPLKKINGNDSDSGSDKSEDDEKKDSDSEMADENCDDDNDVEDDDFDNDYDDDDDDDEDSESIPELVEDTKTKQAPILKRPATEDCSEKSIKKKVKFDDSVPVPKAKQVKLTEQSNDSLKEDIYGRLRDADGKVVNSKPTGYIPPALRQNLSDANAIDAKLNKQMKGLVNRVNEANMAIMSNQLEEMYNCHSRAILNKCFFENICSTAIRPESSLDRLLLELALLIVIIHSNVGEEIGAYIIQNLVENMHKYRKKGNGKELNNVITLMCCMFNLKIFHSTLLFDLIRLFMDSFQEKDVEILSIIFKNCGFGLRKDDPTQLREVISCIQQKSSTVNIDNFEEPGRMRFILDTLLAVKNNNVYKGDHQERFELLQRFTKLAKHLIRNKSIGDNQLRVTLSDLQNADTKGRWWIVGSAWSGETEDSKKADEESIPTGSEEVKNFLELSRKQRMNTDIRRNIFYTLMASEDFVDAFERLLKLKLKPVQERDIIHVIVDCCIQEKEYNPYYAHLLQKFCEFHRRFQMTFQFNLWDKLKDMPSLTEMMMSNLAKLVSHLIVSKAQSLALFKVLEFGTLDKQTVFFLKAVLLDLFENNPSHVINMVFERIAIQTNLYKFREGLRLFIMHFLIGRKKKAKSPTVIKQLQEAVQLLSISHSTTLL